MSDYVYRVVSDDGLAVWEGRGSDPFTRAGSARSRASKLNNDHNRYREDDEGNPLPPVKRYKVQRSKVDWEDFE